MQELHLNKWDYSGYIGGMEKIMETTLYGLGCRDCVFNHGKVICGYIELYKIRGGIYRVWGKVTNAGESHGKENADAMGAGFTWWLYTESRNSN